MPAAVASVSRGSARSTRFLPASASAGRPTRSANAVFTASTVPSVPMRALHTGARSKRAAAQPRSGVRAPAGSSDRAGFIATAPSRVLRDVPQRVWAVGQAFQPSHRSVCRGGDGTGPIPAGIERSRPGFQTLGRRSPPPIGSLMEASDDRRPERTCWAQPARPAVRDRAMNADWVAASVRARAMARRRVGTGTCRGVAAQADLGAALSRLDGTAYAPRLTGARARAGAAGHRRDRALAAAGAGRLAPGARNPAAPRGRRRVREVEHPRPGAAPRRRPGTAAVRARRARDGVAPPSGLDVT